MAVADWFLLASERGNHATRIDAHHPDGTAWSDGNTVRALVHGRPYMAELHQRICAMESGDLLLFVDWRGDPDQQLTDDPGSTLTATLVDAAKRGVVVRGLLWRSHWRKIGYHSHKHRYLGEDVGEVGGQCLRDMRVRTLGAHHQKFLVLRHPGHPEDDIAYLGGIDLCHSRRDDEHHHGDRQVLPMAPAYGATPAWHDVQVAIQGPAVHDVETSFRERWEDSVPLTLNPGRRLTSFLQREDLAPEPLPPQEPPPPEPEGGFQHVQILRTYPQILPMGYDFAPEGERSVALGNAKAIAQARQLVYVEDQYLWSREIGEHFAKALREQPDLKLIIVLPLVPDQAGVLAETPQLYGRKLAMDRILDAAGDDRVAVFGLTNDAGLPIYVHSKACIIDDRWASVGSDNLNRRSWSSDTEIACAVYDERNAAGPEPSDSFAVALRRELVAEHLGCEPAEVPDDPDELFRRMVECADALDSWFSDASGDDAAHGVRGRISARLIRRPQPPGRQRTRRRIESAAADALARADARGERPAGRLRRLDPPELTRSELVWSARAYDRFFDPDGGVPTTGQSPD